MTKRRATARATIADVAKRAGVGSTTVSRILRDPTLVSDKLRARVEQAIADLRYVPDPKARALAAGVGDVVGVLVPSFGNGVFSDVLHGIQDGIAGSPYQIQIADTQYSASEEDRQIALFLSQRPRALILTGVDQSAASRALLRDAGVPIVQIYDLGEAAIDMMVGLSHGDAARDVADHLIDGGYRRIGAIVARMDERVTRRLAGFRARLQERGLYDPALEAASRELSSVAIGRALMAEIFDARPDVDAVFCGNDDLAVGALFECQARGVSVPDQIGIVGFNDLEIAAAAHPALTTVQTHRREIGRTAMDFVRRRLDGAPIPHPQIDIRHTLVARQSTRR